MQSSFETSLYNVEAELQNDLAEMNQGLEDHRTDIYIGNDLAAEDPIPADAQVEALEILSHKI